MGVKCEGWRRGEGGEDIEFYALFCVVLVMVVGGVEVRRKREGRECSSSVLYSCIMLFVCPVLILSSVTTG